RPSLRLPLSSSEAPSSTDAVIGSQNENLIAAADRGFRYHWLVWLVQRDLELQQSRISQELNGCRLRNLKCNFSNPIVNLGYTRFSCDPLIVVRGYLDSPHRASDGIYRTVDLHRQEELSGTLLDTEEVQLHLSFDVRNCSDESFETIDFPIEPPSGLRWWHPPI